MKSLIAIMLCVFYVSGCSTTYTAETDLNENYDFHAVKSYSIVGDEHLKNPMISDIDRNRFNREIENKFSLHGLVTTKQDTADVLISYFVVTKDKIQITSAGHSTYYGHSSRYGNAYGYGYGTPNLNTRNYNEGTFVIDIIDNKTKKTVWRSTLVKPIKSYGSAEKRELAISDLMDTMFADFQSSS